jgi:AraC-like DNA-binding protein
VSQSFDAALAGVRVSFGEVTYPRGATYGPRRQESVQLVFIHDGWAGVTAGGEQLAVAAGHACLLLPGHLEHFRFSPGRDTRHSWVHYWSSAGDEPLLARLAAIPRVQPTSPALARLVAALLAERPAAGPIAALRAYEILYRYVEDARRVPAALEPALTFVEQHLALPLDVDRIATAAAVSRSQLFRLFRAHLGLTPAEYLWERRDELAVELLRDTGLPVAEVAVRCGFRNPKHLARRVRAATGRSPSELRRLDR